MINDDTVKRIEDLHRLKTEGVITEADFEKAKADLLNGPALRKPAATFQPSSREPVALPAPDDHIGWITLPLRRYADFNGRSSRKEFWMFQLAFVALGVVCVMFTLVAGGEAAAGLFLLGILGSVVPLLAVQVRRFHDQDKSGWFALFNLIPYLGAILVFIFMLLEGTRGENQFGPDPRD